jgi:hypothetical protein
MTKSGQHRQNTTGRITPWTFLFAQGRHQFAQVVRLKVEKLGLYVFAKAQ